MDGSMMNPTDVQKLDVDTDGDRVDVQNSDNDPVIGSVRQERAATLRRSSAIAAEPWSTNAAGRAGLPQIFRDRRELLQRRLQVVGNLPRDDLRRRKVGRACPPCGSNSMRAETAGHGRRKARVILDA